VAGLIDRFLEFVGLEEPKEGTESKRSTSREGGKESRGRSSRDDGYGREENDGYERTGYDRMNRDRSNYDYEERAGSGRGGYESDRSRKKGGGKVINHPAADMGQPEMRIFQMKDFNDAKKVIDDMLANRSVLINLEYVDVDESQRIVDMLSGAIYALEASFNKVAANTYLIAPQSVEISGSYEEENESPRWSKGRYSGSSR